MRKLTLVEECVVPANVPWFLGGGNGDRAMEDLRRFAREFMRRFVEKHSLDIPDLEEKMKDI